jgi:hypothetical protein
MDAKQLIAAARRQTGLVSLGDDAILEGLNQLVDVGTLANRLRVENHLAEHPELVERPIDRPPAAGRSRIPGIRCFSMH